MRSWILTTKVFVYGTLRKGFSNSRLLSTAISKGEHLLSSKHLMISLGAFPALIPSEEFHLTRGEVYEVDEDTLSNLDRLEGHPDFYERVEVQGLQVYVMKKEVAGSRAVEVKYGDWSKHEQEGYS